MNQHLAMVAQAAPVVEWLGNRYSVALAAADTNGVFGSFLNWTAAGSGPPLHVHRGEDEATHMLGGAADFWLDGRVIRLVAGQSLFLPRGVPHTFRVPDDGPAHMLTIVTPGGFEAFFAAAAKAGAGPQDPAALQVT